jgi:hypothetical protein
VRELAKAMDYEIGAHWLEIYGRCHACRLLDVAPSSPRTSATRS